MSATFVIDKRDNIISADKGYYLSVGWRGAFKFIGNKNNTNVFNVEWRSFHNVSAEYRFPISRCGGVLGGVLFAHVTTASNQIQDLKLLESIKPGYGFGLRIMADKKSRTTLAIDYAFGNNSSGFYLAASETF